MCLGLYIHFSQIHNFYHPSNQPDLGLINQFSHIHIIYIYIIVYSNNDMASSEVKTSLTGHSPTTPPMILRHFIPQGGNVSGALMNYLIKLIKLYYLYCVMYIHGQLHKRFVNFVNKNAETENEIIQCKAAAPLFLIVSAIYLFCIIYHAIIYLSPNIHYNLTRLLTMLSLYQPV